MTLYNVNVYDGRAFTPSSLLQQLNALHNVADYFGHGNIEHERLEIWTRGTEVGLFVGDTTTLADDGWTKAVATP